MTMTYLCRVAAPLLGAVMVLLRSLLALHQDESTVHSRLPPRLLQELKSRQHDYCNLTIAEEVENSIRTSSISQPLLLELKPSNCSSSIIPVFRYPPGYTSNEANHFLRDGIHKSDCLQETADYRLANIWIYEGGALPNLGDCTEFETLMMNFATKQCPKNVALQNCSLPEWKIIQIDYGDSWTWATNPCGAPFLASKVLKPFNVVWYKRSIVANRTGIDKKWGFVSPYHLQGQPQHVHHIPYGVRSDIVMEIQTTICRKYNLTLPATTKTPLSPVNLQRDGGVRYFFYPFRKNCRGECGGTSTRSLVSLALRELTTEIKNETIASGREGRPFSVSIGLAGEHNRWGRRFVQTAYVQEMLEHKIVVVAQRDNHEDMYRLMEALASGALVFSDPMVAPPKYLVEGEHYVVFTSKEDLKRKVRFYLEECPTERLRIANKGWTLAMQQYRSFHLMEQVILKHNVDI